MSSIFYFPDPLPSYDENINDKPDDKADVEAVNLFI